MREIVLPRMHYATVVGHVVRKLTGHFIDGETVERKAFGMLAGRQRGATLHVAGAFPLLVNQRQDPDRRAEMDEVVNGYAIPSETPNAQRGWIAHPAELLAIERACDEVDLVVFGNYHTHRVAWPHDPRRDTCTQLDRVLADGCGQWTFIVSAVDLHQPSIRAFYEADNDAEASIRLT
ncbi:MPN domain-containing protein [Kibdelosporangium aridum]|uniref:hypothetical protein n=1 Tax=Kibdelosporangium aridum TaxID=2030 RepID=UPI0013598393|nr:hypothetical protein [Kibdelosporangium aridum]